MPAVSEKQKRFMQAVAHNRSFAKKAGVPQSVGREFSQSGGGQVKESKAMMKKEVSFMKKKGAPKSMLKHEMAEAGMKKGGMAKKYAMGGVAGRPAMTGLSRAAAMSGRTMPTTGRPAGMKQGGTASSRADGVAQRGKTRGQMLKKGGTAKKYC